jgi:hypothetical protein
MTSSLSTRKASRSVRRPYAFSMEKVLPAGGLPFINLHRLPDTFSTLCREAGLEDGPSSDGRDYERQGRTCVASPDRPHLRGPGGSGISREQQLMR